MTTLTVLFEDAYLTDPTTPTVSIHATYPERAHASQVEGDVRTYAGGRRRVITSARKSATYPLTLQLLTDADLAQLTAWQGRVLLLRDGAGRRVWGSFLSLDVTDYWHPDGTLHDVSMVLTEVTYTEAV